MRLFYIALAYYSRIPTPKIKEYHPDDATRAIRYFSLVGIIVGMLCNVVYLADAFLPPELRAILVLAIGILATGAFHEDGFADMTDGFGGGYNRDKILAIMKDSRIGSYGVIALILLLGTKFYALLHLCGYWPSWDNLATFLLFPTYHALARMTSGSLIFISTYARTDGSAKITTNDHAWGTTEVVMLLLFGLLPLCLLAYLTSWLLMLVLVPLAILLLWFRHYCHKHIGGYTGDCLGALEQAAELVILISFVIIINYV